jgi:glycosyltransferase involved in cell wall biosynthesis
MRILVVDEEIPWPLNSGKRLRTFNLLQSLASRHEIHFVCRQHQGTENNNPDALLRYGIQPHVVRDPILKKEGGRFYLALLKNIISPYPYSVSSHYSEVLVRKVQKLAQELQFDLIHCEWTPYAINIRKLFASHPTLVDAHNVEAMIWKRNYLVEKNLLKKAFIYLQWKKMAAFEKKFFPQFTRCVAVSQQDAEIIKESTQSNKVDVVSNGVDISYFSQSASPATSIAKAGDLVFTGSLDWRPNVDGILYFLEHIFPGFQQRYPGSVFHIVGRNPMPILFEKVNGLRNVNLAGMVEDVRPYMHQGAIYVVPLRVGGGSRLKILEAFSMELPVVATSVGAEGLDVVHRKHLLLADTPTDFIEAMDQLLQDKEQAKGIAEQGRQLVVNQYQWQVLAERLEKNWQLAVSSWNPLNS